MAGRGRAWQGVAGRGRTPCRPDNRRAYIIMHIISIMHIIIVMRNIIVSIRRSEGDLSRRGFPREGEIAVIPAGPLKSIRPESADATKTSLKNKEIKYIKNKCNKISK